MKKPHICFVAPFAYPVLEGNTAIRHVGGAEVQQCMIARGLAGLRYRVSMVCLDFGQEDDLFLHGVHIVKAHKPQAGIPIIRFIHPRATSIWRAMKKCNADIYYQRSAGMLTGLVALFCKYYKRFFAYAAASDTDFIQGEELIHYDRDRLIYRWGLKHSDAVIVQNETQRRF